MLISQDVAPAGGGLHCPDPSDVHAVADPQPELLHKHGQVDGGSVGWGVELAAHSLEQEIRFIAQQRVPVMAQVELSVLPSCVDLVNADELPVPGKPSQRSREHMYQHVRGSGQRRVFLYTQFPTC